MKKNAPHLPPKTCLTDSHHRRHDIKLIVYSVLIALASGVASSLVLFNYFYPTVYDNNSVYVRSNRTTASGDLMATLGAAVVRDWRYQIVQIYDEAKIIQPGIYPASSFVGKGVVLNSGGWAVLYAPSWTADKMRHLMGIDSLGVRFPIEKFILDKENNLVYLKFKGEFRGTTIFADWKNITQDRQVWAVNGEWNTGIISETVDVGNTQLSALKIMSKYSISGYSAHEGVAINNRGDWLGFVDAAGNIIPSWLIEHNIISILNTGDIEKGTVDWRGFFVNGMREGANWKEVKGFYISDSKQIATDAKIGKGDILLKINDELVTKSSLARLIISASSEFNATVLRNGNEVMLSVKKQGK